MSTEGAPKPGIWQTPREIFVALACVGAVFFFMLIIVALLVTLTVLAHRYCAN